MADPSAPSSRGAAAGASVGIARFDPEAAITHQAPGGIACETGALHRLLVETVEDYAIFALDAEGFILSWNAGAEHIKGYRADEVIGRHFSIFYPPERVAEDFPAHELRQAAQVGRFEDEGWRIRSDGSRFWANVVITALRDSTGLLIGYAKVTRDLTARREAEEALRVSEERFRLLVEGVRDYAMFVLDSTGHITTWNPGAERIKGFTAQEILGQLFSIFYPPDDVASEKPRRALEAATRLGAYEEEGWRVRKDGSRFWANVVITALRTRQGTLAGFANVTRDLTERRAAHERALEDARRIASEETARQLADAVRERSERLQALTAALSSAYTVAEVADVVLENGLDTMGAAAGALAMVDPSSDALRVVGDRGYRLLPALVAGLSLQTNVPMAEAIRTGKPVICHSRAERDERFPMTAEVLAPFGATAVLPLTARGRIFGALAMHRAPGDPLCDRTLEFMEAFAQQAAPALERAILYEAAQKAKAQAHEANKAKSEFLSAMSHELRTPLNAIACYADLIAMGIRGPVTDEQREDLQRIKRAQQHLLSIINEILNFARLDAGQVAYTYESVPLSEVLAAVSSMIAPQAATKGLHFQEGPCPDGVVVWADQAKLRQVLLNLLSNAVKFTTHGDVTVECRWDHPHHVAITVRDSGVGIPTAQLERIFEPFVQVGRSLTAVSDGTGLGLAISRTLARGMGGEITVESGTGAGSAFTLRVPRPPDRTLAPVAGDQGSDATPEA